MQKQLISTVSSTFFKVEQAGARWSKLEQDAALIMYAGGEQGATW